MVLSLRLDECMCAAVATETSTVTKWQDIPTTQRHTDSQTANQPANHLPGVRVTTCKATRCLLFSDRR